MCPRSLGESGGLSPGGKGFVGRNPELDRLAVLMVGSAQLVTLIGPGGIGKTRLAEEAVRRLRRARRISVFVVRLAGLPKGADAGTVREAVAESVVLEGFAGVSAWEGAVRRLTTVDAEGRAVPAVLLIDNCEHVLASAGAVIADLLDAVEGLTILATSREPLRWVGEQLVTVSPLSAKQSLELFEQRAELVGHPITQPGEVALAQQICRHMHGHPLFIRLAAGRMFYEPLSLILEQLSGESGDRRMRWRHGPQVGSEHRHRGIGDVIWWSYDLCEEKERLLFDRLSVFASGYETSPDSAGAEGSDESVVDVGAELEAIEVVCADDVLIPGCEDAPSGKCGDDAVPAVRLTRSEIRGLLERLVEQSLVSVYRTADSVRYFLLESLRLFAADRLGEVVGERVDEPARLERRHRCYYRDKFLQLQANWLGPAEQELLRWVQGAWSDVRRAIDTSLAAGEPAIGLQICVGLLPLRASFYLGSLSEIRGRIEQTLAATQASQHQPTELEVAAMALIAWLSVVQGRPRDTEELLERCVAACGIDVADGGHWRDRPHIDRGLPAVVELAWGAELMFIHRDPVAIAVLGRAREKFHRMAVQGGEAMSGMHEALAAGFFGSAEQAMNIVQRHLQRTVAAAAGWSQSWAQMALAIVLTRHGDAEEALLVGRSALAHQLALGDQWGTTWVVHIRTWSLTRLITDQMTAGNVNRSSLVELATEIAYLAGGLKTQRAWQGVVIENMGPVADETSTAEQIARNVLGDDTYTTLEKRGLGLSPKHFEVHRLALGTLAIETSADSRPATDGTPTLWQTLSKAEREVAILAAAGWPNSMIGLRRGTSFRTTDAQIASIFHKLIINSREEIIRFVPENLRSQVSAETARATRLGPTSADRRRGC